MWKCWLTHKIGWTVWILELFLLEHFSSWSFVQNKVPKNKSSTKQIGRGDVQTICRHKFDLKWWDPPSTHFSKPLDAFSPWKKKKRNNENRHELKLFENNQTMSKFFHSNMWPFKRKKDHKTVKITPNFLTFSNNNWNSIRFKAY